MTWPNWFYPERRRQLAAMLHALALGQFAVIGFTDFQRGGFRPFLLSSVLFVAFEAFNILLTPRKPDDERRHFVAYRFRNWLDLD